MNTILNLLHHRRSSKKFGTLAPNEQQLKQILTAGLRVPDHGRLKPYHFVVIEKAQMITFEKCLKSAATEFALGEEGIKKAENLSQIAPLVIGVVAKIEQAVKKVPEWEQQLTAGCATYAMQLAANALGFETCWITGKWVESLALRTAFRCREQDQIVALLMIGSPAEGNEISRWEEPLSLNDFVSEMKEGE